LRIIRFVSRKRLITEFKKFPITDYLLTDVENCAIPYSALRRFTERTEYSKMTQGSLDLHLVRDGFEGYLHQQNKLLEKP